jgi:hypothetical protein
MITSKRFRWQGMAGEKRNACRVLMGNPEEGD